MAEFRIGQTVETSAHQQGLVKYVGQIHVAEGVWLGIELSTPTGKNDGSLRGERYFTCPPGHGLFVKDASILRVVSQPVHAAPPSTPKAAAPKPKPAAAAAPRPRPSSVVAPKPAPRASIIGNKRQSLAPSTTYAPSRAPVRKASVAGSSIISPSETSDSNRRPTLSASRPSISSTTSNSTAAKASRDGNVETLQTKIRHLEKQHNEAQEKLRELAQTKDERDRFKSIIDKLQSKFQSNHTEMQDLKEQLKTLQLDNDTLNKSHQDHEIDLEDALVDKEMAEERADQAEAEVDSLRKKIEERDLELEILQEEAKLYTADMSEEEKQDAGYYRLQHENDRLRQALVGLKEMTEEKEQDLKATILSLEADLTNLETYESENANLQQRVIDAEALVEDLKQRLEAAEEADDMVEELSTQNQNLQDRVAEQDLVIQDLENLRELNDELEVQHLEQEEELRAELEAKDNELTEQAQVITEQTSVIADQETLISKFRDLVIELQSKMASAEDSRTMTEAQVKDTTGRFNEVMDLNRQLRAATVQSTARDIDGELMNLKHNQLSEQLQIWDETQSKEFVNSDSLKAYMTSKRIFGKAELLKNMLFNANKQMTKAGRLDEASISLICHVALSHLAILRDDSDRLWRAISSSTLEEFANFGPTYQELVTIEHIIDQGLHALKVDAVNFDELAGSLGRSGKIHEAILTNHQQILAERPEDDFLYRVGTIKTRLMYIDGLYTVVMFALQKVPAGLLDTCADLREQFRTPSEKTKGALTAATSLKKTLYALRRDSMYPQPHMVIDDIAMQKEHLARAADNLTAFAQKLVEEIMRCSTLSGDESIAASELESAKHLIEELGSDERSTFGVSGISGLAGVLRDWSDHVSILMNNIEIERKPTPWTQKAKEVETARKKDEEIARQLQTLANEHRATILKIHEREQIIATKELEIEHLSAKNRDAAAKIEDVEALQAQVKERSDKIVKLEAEGRALTQEIQALKERGARSDHSTNDEVEATPVNTTNGGDPIEHVTMTQAPIGLKTLLDALQNENHWLREREQKANLELNKELFTAWLPERHQTRTRSPLEMLDMVLDSSMLSDDDDDVDELSTPNSSSPIREHLTPLSLRGIQLGWQSRSESLKEALELAEESMLSTIYEEDEFTFFSVHA